MGPGTCIGFVCEGPESAEYSLTFDRLRTTVDGGGDVSPTGGGDWNGDGVEELVIAVPSDFTPDDQPTALVVDGRASGLYPDANEVEMRIVDGKRSRFDRAVAVDDVNGDGVREIAVTTSIDIAVVFGRLDGSTVDLRHLGDDGFRIANPTNGNGEWAPPYPYAYGLASPGDLNGDGRGDLVSVDDGIARVVFPPADAAGELIDTSAPGPSVSLLHPTGQYDADVGVSGPGDLNGDGTPDLLVSSLTPTGATDTAAITSLEPNSDIDLQEIAESGDGFELHTGPGVADNDDFAHVVGDRNRDGLPDLLLYGPDESLIAYTPPVGTDRTFGDIEPGEGTLGGAGRWGLGDLDGDGIVDSGGDGKLFTSGDSDPLDPTGARWREHRGRIAMWGEKTVDLLADQNGDGVPEELTTSFDFKSGTNELESRTVRTFFARPFIPIEVEPAINRRDFYEFRGRVQPTPENRASLNGAIQAVVYLYDSAGSQRGTMYGGYWDYATGEVEQAKVPSLFHQFIAGPITFRIGLIRDGKTLAQGPMQNLADAVEGAPINYGPGYVDPSELPPFDPSEFLNQILGTRKGDRLVGTSDRDLIRGGKGSDRLSGRGSDDQLVGGPGRDVLRCGAGDDVAFTDGRDRLVGCESRLRIATP